MDDSDTLQWTRDAINIWREQAWNLMEDPRFVDSMMQAWCAQRSFVAAQQKKSAAPPATLDEFFRELCGSRRLSQFSDWQISQQASSFMEGLRSYNRARYRGPITEPPVAWKSGSARLLNFTETPRAHGKRSTKPILLLIPSLINRYYILDLNKETSFARHLAAQGYAVYLMDWGTPGREEKDFSAADYVTDYLTNVTDWLKKKHPDAPLFVAGHCMGGMLAMGLAAHRPDALAGLALLATPWDFRPMQMPFHARMLPQHEEALREYIHGFPVFPGDQLMLSFYWRDPFIFHDKYLHFHDLKNDMEQRERFLTLEYWVNDVAPITTPVAENCFLDWLMHNDTLEHRWKVGKRIVMPEKIRVPTLLAIPERDRIVPPEASYMLADALPFVTTITPDCGHVGMIVGSRAKELVWEPFTEWVESIA